MIKFRRKSFTKWDETDNLKRMKDSDILAEKKKKVGYGNVATSALSGAVVGAAGAGLVGSAVGAGTGSFMGRRVAGFKKGGKYGAIAGGLLAGAAAISKNNKQAKENQFYNQRLEYAQRQARRREKKDWKQNMTQRDGYSY